MAEKNDEVDDQQLLVELVAFDLYSRHRIPDNLERDMALSALDSTLYNSWREGAELRLEFRQAAEVSIAAMLQQGVSIKLRKRAVAIARVQEIQTRPAAVAYSLR